MGFSVLLLQGSQGVEYPPVDGLDDWRTVGLLEPQPSGGREIVCH